MSKIDLDPITSGYNLSKINANFQKIEDTLNKEVLYRKEYLGEPNEMQTNLDMNGKQILNVTTGTSDGSLVTKGYVDQGLALKFDKSGGTLSGPVDMQNNQINNLPNATKPSQPATYAQLLQVEAPGDSLLRSELAAPGGAGLVGGIAISVGSIKDLATAPKIDGRQYSVKGFYADTDVGGGMFYWDASRDKADHNGGTIIDHDRITAWDGTQADLNTLFSAGTGLGCFVRVKTDSLPITCFGAQENSNLYWPLRIAVKSVFECIVDVKESFVDIGANGLIDIQPHGLKLSSNISMPMIRLDSNVFTTTQNTVGLILRGIHFVGDPSTGAPSLFSNPTERLVVVDSIDVQKCKFENRLRLMYWVGSPTDDPDVTPFGIGKMKFNNNDCKNIHNSFIGATNLPIPLTELKNNNVRNFSFVFLNRGITNEGSYIPKIRGRSVLIASNNHVVCDDDYFAETSGGAYYCFVLTETYETVYENNHVEGMHTVDGDIALYDIYASSLKVTYRGNTFKNNACLSTNDELATRFLIKSKSEGVDTDKVYEGNEYIFDDDIHTRWGVSETLIKHFLWDFREGGLVVKNNYFKLKTLLLRPAGEQCAKFTFTGNTIKAKYSASIGSASGYLLGVNILSPNSSYEVTYNTLSIEDLGGGTAFLVGTTGVQAGASIDNFLIKGNTVLADNGVARIYRRINSGVPEKGVIQSNNYTNLDGYIDVFSAIGGQSLIDSDYYVFDYNGTTNSRLIGGWLGGHFKFTTDLISCSDYPTLDLPANVNHIDNGFAFVYLVKAEVKGKNNWQKIGFVVYVHNDGGVLKLRYQRLSDSAWVDQEQGGRGNYNLIKPIFDDVLVGNPIIKPSNVGLPVVRLGVSGFSGHKIKWDITVDKIPSADMPALTP